MLDSLSETLRGLQVVDQSALRNALGAIQGSQTRDTSRSFTITAGGTPKVVTSEDNSTQSDQENKTTSGSDSLDTLIDKKVSDKLGLKKETTVSERSPAIPGLPDLIAGPAQPATLGQNALDLLSDQVNLTYQIFNVRMLLERSLSDRLLDSGQQRLQTVLGFNISLDPPHDAADSAAVVEITVRDANDQPVSLVSLLPQEKTYNSVALSTKSNAFGGSAVVKMVTLGYNERRRSQNYYLYRDNDTLSFERMQPTSSNLVFGWQFRPVLGRRSVGAGMRQMFAVLSMPVSDTADEGDLTKQLKVTVRTYWRKYYPDSLTTAYKDEIGPWPHIKKALTLGTANTVPNGRWATRDEVVVEVPTTARYEQSLKPVISDIRWTQIDDKTALVSVAGENFFTGTTAIMGGSSASTAVNIKSNQALDIITPIENIGAGDAVLVGRYGPAVPLGMQGCTPTSELQHSRLSPAFAGQRELTMMLTGCSADEFRYPLSVFANGKHVPGTPSVTILPPLPTGRPRDCPGLSPCALVVAHIPVSLFPKGEGTLSVVNPFRPKFAIGLTWYDDEYYIQRVPGSTKTILYVRRRDDIPISSDYVYGVGATTRWMAEYEGTSLTPVFDDPAIMKLEIAKADAEGLLVLKAPLTDSTNHKITLLELPPSKPKAKAAIEAAPGVSLSVNQNDAAKLDFTGEKVDSVQSVRIEGRDSLKTEYDSEKKSLSVYLTSDVTKLPAKLALQFRDGSNKLVSSLVLEVKALPKQTASTAGASRRSDNGH